VAVLNTVEAAVGITVVKEGHLSSVLVVEVVEAIAVLPMLLVLVMAVLGGDTLMGAVELQGQSTIMVVMAILVVTAVVMVEEEVGAVTRQLIVVLVAQEVPLAAAEVLEAEPIMMQVFLGKAVTEQEEKYESIHGRR
jgi:hypothetical protein